MTRKLTALLLVLIIPAMLLLPGCDPKSAVTLSVLTWADYFDDAALEEFEKETGIRIEQTYYMETTEEAIDKLSSVDTARYDVVMLSDYVVEMCRKNDLIQKLNLDLLSNYSNVDGGYQSKFYDPDNEYTVPFLAGAPILVYNSEKTAKEITSYADLFDSGLKGKVVAMDDYRVLPGMVLMSMGQSMNTTDKTVLAKLKTKMLELKPNILALDSQNPQDKLISGEATVGILFNSQVSAIIRDHQNFKAVYPKEGVGFGIDSFSVAKQSKQVEAAHQFINFCLQGERSAQNSEFNGYTNCNTAAGPFFSQAYLNDKAINIPDALLTKAEFLRTLDNDVNKEYLDIWTAFKQ